MGHNRLSQTGLGSIYNTFISQYFISQAYHWPCTFYFCIEPVWVSYNQSQGPSVPSVHSSFHKYYHNRISGHKYQPGIKWRSHLDYNACIVHNDYLNTLQWTTGPTDLLLQFVEASSRKELNMHPLI